MVVARLTRQPKGGTPGTRFHRHPCAGDTWRPSDSYAEVLRESTKTVFMAQKLLSSRPVCTRKISVATLRILEKIFIDPLQDVALIILSTDVELDK